jgi:molecular chaperone GrpE
VLDDVDRARAHGDLTGAFKAVADQLESTLEKLGLQPFGAAGDPFDPMLHEAVAHSGSAGVTVPTCMVVLRRGFRLGDRLLRPALVTVADPAAEDPVATAEPIAPTDLPAPGAAPAADQAAADGPAAASADQPTDRPATSATASTAAWTPPKSAPGGSSPATADARAGVAEPELGEDGETPVAWFDKPGEQQD